jgi:hypothetical protein
MPSAKSSTLFHPKTFELSALGAYRGFFEKFNPFIDKGLGSARGEGRVTVFW